MKAKNLNGSLFPARGAPKPLTVSRAALSPAQSRSEDDHLISLFVWIRQWQLRYPVLMRAFHVENEGALVGERREHTNRRGETYTYSPAGMKRKKKGVRGGVLDVINLTPRRGYHGFVCELKVRDGELSGSQRAELEYLVAEGYFGHVTWSWSEMARLMPYYFEIDDRVCYQSAGNPDDYLIPRLGGHNERCGCEMKI